VTATTPRTIIVGAGIYGVTAALALAGRGHRVTLADPGPIPHPLAASTDISKVIRMEYGDDADYMELGERSRVGWLAWNREWPEPLYHETGVLMLSRVMMEEGGFEHDSYELLLARGHAPERMSSRLLRERYPAWNAANYPDGFYHSEGGYAESGRVVARLAEIASANGVALREGSKYRAWTERGNHVTGIECEDGSRIESDFVVLAGGAWTGHHHPELRECFRATGQPVFHLRPENPELYTADRFPVYTADVARTGWYGFPLNRDGIVKIGNHGPGRLVDPDGPREVLAEDHERLRAFLADTFPGLVDAPVVYTRLCLYSDTWDSHFWIARDPKREGLVVASGGSGHGFKFAPVLGDIAADALEERENPLSHKFRWRPEVRPDVGAEAARFYGE
jgi:glycine/D-amino acid oxidase-like deaminating enzyme